MAGSRKDFLAGLGPPRVCHVFVASRWRRRRRRRQEQDGRPGDGEASVRVGGVLGVPETGRLVRERELGRRARRDPDNRLERRGPFARNSGSIVQREDGICTREAPTRQKHLFIKKGEKKKGCGGDERRRR